MAQDHKEDQKIDDVDDLLTIMANFLWEIGGTHYDDDAEFTPLEDARELFWLIAENGYSISRGGEKVV